MSSRFRPAPEIEQIAQSLIAQYHSRLTMARIAYLWRDGGWMSQGRDRFGRTIRLGEREEAMTGRDFAVIINAEAWLRLSPAQHHALVDHELSHCGCRVKKDGTQEWCIWPHDLEEFADVVDRHGLWMEDVVTFGKAIARQLKFPFGAPAADVAAAAGGP